MPLRIQVSSASNGSPVAFTFGVNPSFFDPQDSPAETVFSVLHGTDIYQKQSFDSRPREFIWQSGFDVSDTNLSAIIAYFRSIEGETRYFNFKDIEDINDRWDTTGLVDPDWKKVRIISIVSKYKRGGKLRYDGVSLLFSPEEP